MDIGPIRSDDRPGLAVHELVPAAEREQIAATAEFNPSAPLLGPPGILSVPDWAGLGLSRLSHTPLSAGQVPAKRAECRAVQGLEATQLICSSVRDTGPVGTELARPDAAAALCHDESQQG